MKKILVTYATYGSGHKTVAEYLYKYIKTKNKYEVKILDLMDYSNTIGKLSVELFNINFKFKTNMLHEMTYEFFDNNVTSSPYKLVAKSIVKNEKFKQEILNYKPDILISTHFFPSTLISDLNLKKKLNCKIITIITDYKSHCFWTKNSKNEDALIVSNNMVKNELINKGVDKKKIYTYGIPISDNFKIFDNKNKIYKLYNIDNNKKTILFFGGGSLGSTFSYNYIKKVLESNYNVNIIFVCGKNEKLKEKVDSLIKQFNYKNIICLGFTKDISNLMNISDFIITKPGGITITECLEMKKPMLLIPGIGGQERYNMKYLCKNGYAYNCKNSTSLNKIIYKLLNKKNMLKNMYIKLDKQEKNNSIEKIYLLAEKLIKNK